MADPGNAADDDVNVVQRLMIDGGDKAFNMVPKFLARVIKEEQWKNHNDAGGKPFASFEAFVTHRYWQGLESNFDELRSYCRRHPEVVALIDGAVEPQAPLGVNQHTGGCDIITPSKRGTSATYTLKRLKRDRPDLHKRIVAGELSANAAAIEAGFRKQPTTLDQLRKAWAKATAKERKTFLREIS